MKTFLLLALISLNGFAQTTTATLPASSTSAPAVGSPANTTTGTVSTTAPGFWQRNFKINYFSETLGPSVKRWDDNEIEDDGVKKREPITMYHSFNVRYLMTEKFNLFMSPRVNTVIGDRNDLRATQEQHVLYSDDWQFGIFYTWVKTTNFQYNNRLTHREPFSRKSRFENINSQVEWQHDFTYAFTPALRAILWNNYRYYAYNQDGTDERYRINFTTLLNYVVNDKFNVQVMHEWDMQHRNPKDADNDKHRDAFFFKRYKNYASFGVGYSPTQNFTIIPFIRVLDERDVRNETTMVGLWLLGKVI